MNLWFYQNLFGDIKNIYKEKPFFLMIMDKRGQVYILAAVVLAVAIFGVIKITNQVNPPSKVEF